MGIPDQIGQPVFVATHPRSGTHLTIDLLRKQFDACKGWLWFGETLHHLYLNLDRLSPAHPQQIDREKAFDLLSRASRPTIKTHYLPSFSKLERDDRRLAQQLMDEGDVLYVVRDGRDVMCSAYLWKKVQKEDFDPSFSDFLRQKNEGLTRIQGWAEHVRRWTSRSDAHVIRFEDILSSPKKLIQEFGNILESEPRFETPYLPQRAERKGILADYWRRLTRNFESTNIVGRASGVEPPDWDEVATIEDRTYLAEQAGDILKQFDYVLSGHMEGKPST